MRRHAKKSRFQNGYNTDTFGAWTPACALRPRFPDPRERNRHRAASTDADLARIVAACHLGELTAQLRRAGHAPTPYLIAFRWNAGPRADDYAMRVQRLYFALATSG